MEYDEGMDIRVFHKSLAEIIAPVTDMASDKMNEMSPFHSNACFRLLYIIREFSEALELRDYLKHDELGLLTSLRVALQCDPELLKEDKLIIRQIFHNLDMPLTTGESDVSVSADQIPGQSGLISDGDDIVWKCWSCRTQNHIYNPYCGNCGRESTGHFAFDEFERIQMNIFQNLTVSDDGLVDQMPGQSGLTSDSYGIIWKCQVCGTNNHISNGCCGACQRRPICGLFVLTICRQILDLLKKIERDKMFSQSQVAHKAMGAAINVISTVDVASRRRVSITFFNCCHSCGNNGFTSELASLVNQSF